MRPTPPLASHAGPDPALPTGIEPLTADEPRRVGTFRVVGRIGVGGMGTVYAALDDADRRTAVKCVHRVYAADAEFRERFAREVALVRRVRAACAPRFLDADPGADLPWLATEYVPGPTLDEYVRTHGPLTGRVLTALAIGLAEALAAIHTAGVVHRDLKPGNVILSPDGPKVLDFGIARAVEETALTRTGGLVGTPGWIAPEQYRGAPASERSDMYAWGGLVAFAATGRHPHGSGSSDTMAARILSEPPGLDGVPDGLRRVLERALDKDPERRPDAVTAMRQVSAPLHPDEAPTEVTGGGDVDIRAVMGQAWTRIPIADSSVEEWRRCAPRRRSWVVRRRVPLAVGAAVTALVVLAVAVVGTLVRDEVGTGAGERVSGTDVADGSTTGQEVGSGVPSDVPEEYHDLYENGRVVVEPASDTSAALLRRLESASGGGEGLDQVRLSFTATDMVGDGAFVNVTAEYLLDFGEVQISEGDFGWDERITAGQDDLDITLQTGGGNVHVLSARNPTARLVLDLDVERTLPVYYLPAGVQDDGAIPADYPGGVCFRPENIDEALELEPLGASSAGNGQTDRCSE